LGRTVAAKSHAHSEVPASVPAGDAMSFPPGADGHPNLAVRRAPMSRIVLASSSPRRRELLARVGIRFTVVEPPEDQAPPPGMCADLAVQLLARQKEMAVASEQPAGTFVIGADTMVIGPRGPLGKPGTQQRAREMLGMLRGSRHTVLTGICAISAPDAGEALGVSRSAVRMREFSDTDLEAYVASGEPLDKAGGYAIQGGAAGFVTTLRGSYTSVVGLPLAEVLIDLEELGFDV